MTWYIKALIALLFLGAGAAGVWAYNNAIEKAVEAKQAAKVAQEAADEQKEANAELKAKVAKMNVLLGKKVADDAKFRQRIDDFETRLQGTVAADPQARAWDATPVPASVRDSVREQPVRGAQNGGAGNPSGAANKAGTTPLRLPNQWGSAAAR